MGYVAVKGGREAIDKACQLFAYERIKGASPSLAVDQIKEHLYLAVDRVMGEGGLYAPELAALALKQAAGDTFEAAFMLRAFRATQQRLGYSLTVDCEKMRIIRRISSAFKDIPGGQILGATSDYSLRLLDFDLLSDDQSRRQAFEEKVFGDLAVDVEIPATFPKVISILRREGLLAEALGAGEREAVICDITRQPLTFPAPRSATLQSLARGETGGMLALAYSSMRGYGNIHPTLGELRVGYLPLQVRHPLTGEATTIGEVKVTEAEVLAKMQVGDGPPKFSLGYGLCLGQNEIKAISMAVLDRCTRSRDPQSPAEDQEFVLYHTDGIEAMGFCNHWKLPHYVDFLSDLDRLRKTRELARTGKDKEENNAAR